MKFIVIGDVSCSSKHFASLRGALAFTTKLLRSGHDAYIFVAKNRARLPPVRSKGRTGSKYGPSPSKGKS